MPKFDLPYQAPETEGPYSVSLRFTNAGSDKVYMLSIEPRDGAYVVNYANGRFGSTLKSDTKTKQPVSYEQARKVCNKVLAEKVGSGYLPTAGSHLGNGMVAEAIATAERKDAGVVPQLLNPIGFEDLDHFLSDDAYVAEEKHDGERRMLIARGGEITGANRQGKTVPVSAELVAAARAIGRDVVLDGEQVGNCLHVWDVLELDGNDLRALPLADRRAARDSLDVGLGGLIVITETACSPEAKRALLERVRDRGGEGVVFKRDDAVYEPGRPNSGGNWMKLKFWQSLSAAVGDVNNQRSVALNLKGEAGDWIPVGNVTVPANHPIPEIGDVVEIRYLYAYEGGSLFQPVYLGKRNDLALDECRASQRVFKGAAAPETAVDALSL